RKIVLVPGKTAITIHVIYIEIDGIAGDLLFTEITGNIHHPALRVITPAALMKAEAPFRRHLMCSRQCMVPLNYIHDMRPMDIIILQFTSISPKAHLITFLLCKVEMTF